MACQRFDGIAAHGLEIVYKHSCRICLCDGIRVSQIRISKKEGHFSPAFSMLCIEAGESFPEISTDRISFILGRGKKGQRISCGSRALLPSTVLPGRNRGRCGRPVRPEKDRMKIRSRIKWIALTTRSGSPLSE